MDLLGLRVCVFLAWVGGAKHFPPVATPIYAPACLLAFRMCHDGVSNCKIYTCKEFWFSSTWNTHTHTRTGTPEPRHLNEDSMLYLDPA